MHCQTLAPVVLLILLLHPYTICAKKECILTSLQDLRSLRDSSPGVDIYAVMDGFSVHKDGQCYEAKYDSLSDHDKARYDQIQHIVAEERRREKEAGWKFWSRKQKS